MRDVFGTPPSSDDDVRESNVVKNVSHQGRVENEEVYLHDVEDEFSVFVSEGNKGNDDALDNEDPSIGIESFDKAKKCKKPCRELGKGKKLGHKSLDMKRMVGISTGGDSSMIAHREALSAMDACKVVPCLSHVDNIAKKVYSWISGSSVRHTEFQKLLYEMDINVLEVLKVHEVKWLARGRFMEQMTNLMPSILSY
ncbi:hypothetical protein L7F22_061701 [Adiantum nelumboides]|nr:hypothetical protein [Adiantum nelumboides]